MLTANVWGFFREILAKQSLNPNKGSGMGSWVESDMSVGPSLPAMKSRDRSLPLALRLEALEAELAQFERMLPDAGVVEVIDVPDTNF